jgi:quercetin dioxygenase-like cupin family protein
MRTEDGLVVVGASEGLIGPDDIVVKLQASQTGGRWGVAVGSGVPGEGGRTHVHVGEPEGFFLLQGEIELIGASSRTPIGSGTFVLVPPDTEHGLRIVGTGGARWLAIWPAALDGFVEDLLTIDPDNPAMAADVRARHGIQPGRDRRDGS